MLSMVDILIHMIFHILGYTDIYRIAYNTLKSIHICDITVYKHCLYRNIYLHISVD